MGIDVGDFDNDRPFDLVVTNCAHDYDTLYRNLGGSFVDHSFVAGSRSRRSLLSAGVSISWTWITTWTSISSCPMDIVVSNQDARPTYLVNETEGGGRSILVELIDTQGTRQALGARLEATAGGVAQIRQISSGGSYASQNDFRAHFGLGENSTLDRLTITWLDGTRETHEGLLADRGYAIRRGAPPVPVLSR